MKKKEVEEMPNGIVGKEVGLQIAERTEEELLEKYKNKFMCPKCKEWIDLYKLNIYTNYCCYCG